MASADLKREQLQCEYLQYNSHFLQPSIKTIPLTIIL